MELFDGSQKEIGRGAQAVVYEYQGFAYKVYQEQYPKQYIQGEYLIQEEINQLPLPVVHYYHTEYQNVIKMDLIQGITLEKRIRGEQYDHGIEDMIDLQKSILSNTNSNLPTLKFYALSDLSTMEQSVDHEQLELARKILNEIPETRNLLHFDLHFQNIMYAQEKYYIIDWMNARTGNPIYDYARSYVILNEVATELAAYYKALLVQDSDIDLEHFDSAVYVMALLRTREHKNKATDELIAHYIG